MDSLRLFCRWLKLNLSVNDSREAIAELLCQSSDLLRSSSTTLTSCEGRDGEASKSPTNVAS